jgi:hypothetical protein
MTFDIEAIERQLWEDARRTRQQVSTYEAHQLNLQWQMNLAIMQYTQAMAACWVLALRPGPLNGEDHGT